MTDRDHTIDGAKIFCPAAVPWLRKAGDVRLPLTERLFAWRMAYECAFQGLFDRDVALQSLTPGGSEYVNDPARCVRLARYRQEALHEERAELARVRADRDQLLAAATAVRDDSYEQELEPYFHVGQDAIGAIRAAVAKPR